MRRLTAYSKRANAKTLRYPPLKMTSKHKIQMTNTRFILLLGYLWPALCWRVSLVDA